MGFHILIMENAIDWDEVRKKANSKYNDPHRFLTHPNHTRGHLLRGILETTSNNELNEMYHKKKGFRKDLKYLIL